VGGTTSLRLQTKTPLTSCEEKVIIDLTQTAVLAVLTCMQVFAAFRSLSLSRKQGLDNQLSSIERHFSSVTELMAVHPRTRALFCSDDVSKKINESDLTPDDFQIAAIVAESLCDAFDQVALVDSRLKHLIGEERLYGAYRDRMLRESAFLRKFLLARADQYDVELVEEARKYDV